MPRMTEVQNPFAGVDAFAWPVLPGFGEVADDARFNLALHGAALVLGEDPAQLGGALASVGHGDVEPLEVDGLG